LKARFQSPRRKLWTRATPYRCMAPLPATCSLRCWLTGCRSSTPTSPGRRSSKPPGSATSFSRSSSRFPSSPPAWSRWRPRFRAKIWRGRPHVTGQPDETSP